MFRQYAMRQSSMPQQFYRAIEVPFQPFFAYTRVGMVIQRLIHASDGFHLLQHCADVMADKNDSAIMVNFSQQFVKPGFEAFVYIRTGLVEDNKCRIGNDGTSQ